MAVLCTICARGGSKGLPNKAFSLIDGKPLIGYTIEQALRAKVFDHVIISTDSKAIAKKSKTFGADYWFLRPKKLAGDNSNKLDVIRHALREAEKFYKIFFNTVVDLDITSPLRSIFDIQKSLKYFFDKKADNLISVCPSKKNPYFNMVEIVNGRVQVVKKQKKTFTTRQKAPKVYEMNAAIYIWKRETILSSNNLFTGKTCLYKMKKNQSIDIDNQNDLDIVQFLLKKNND